MNKILIFASPVSPFQRLVFIKDGNASEVGVQTDDLSETILDLAEKHSLETVEFRGNREYCLGLMHKLCQHTHYTNTITVKYFGG